jgi:hypothetical protein
MLVAWGIYAQHIGLVKQLMQVSLHQKIRDHTPQKKVLEFLVAILAGLPHMQDISQSAHPLDKDVALAQAWGQTTWADYSGVSRTLQSLTEAEVTEIIRTLNALEQPVLEQELALSLHQRGCLVYDGDLTGRPISDTCITYPNASFGYMGDGVRLGYQSAVVTVASPTFGRLWVTNQLHSGSTVSSTQAQALVRGAEARTGLRPRRRTELVAERLAQVEAAQRLAEEAWDESRFCLHQAQDKTQETADQLRHWRQEVVWLEAEYQREGCIPTPHCRLTRAHRKVTTLQGRLPRNQAQLARAQRRFDRHERTAHDLHTEARLLRDHLTILAEENQANPAPIRAIFRLDSGFATQENIAWLIEMGYDIYTKARSTKIRDWLMAEAKGADWQRVGSNAHLAAWSQTTADGCLPYPMNMALARYQIGETQRHAVLLHYGQDVVTQNLDGWFHMYNGRQTIEAGIKEGKGVFQMHHLKVRSAQALRLQEHLACFAANFVRQAASWLSTQPQHPSAVRTDSVKHLVQVLAHTSAWVHRQGDVWLLTFTEQSLYAGHSLQLGPGVVQLPLPFASTIHFQHF